MIHRLPASRRALVCAILLAVNALHASQDSVLIPGQFFLADRFLNDAGYRLQTNYMVGGLSATLQMRDLALDRAPLSYAGSIQKPFDNELPFVESYALSLRFPSRESRVAAGISLGVDINALSYDREESAWGWNGGSETLDQFYLREREERVRTTRTCYTGTGNLLCRALGGFAAVAVQGSIVQHAGYECVETKDYYGGNGLELRDYEPDDLSYEYFGGVLFTKAIGARRPLFNLVFGVDYSDQRDRLALTRKVDTIPFLGEYQVLTITYGGFESRRNVINAWIGFRPQFPQNLDKVNMVLRGRLIHGLMLREFSLAIVGREDWLTDSSFAFTNALAPPVIRSVMYHTSRRSTTGRLEPELFLTRQVSLTVPLSGRMESNTLMTGEAETESFHHSYFPSITGALIARLYVNVTDDLRLEVSASSGEFCARSEGSTSASLENAIFLYRAYTAGIGLSLSGTY